MNERIKKLRKTLDLTQLEFAERLGMKQNTIATYEMGRSNPSDPTINNICKEFNVSETWLRTGAGEMFNKVTRDEEIASFVGGLFKDEEPSFKRRFISMLSRLDESEWAVLERMSLAMAEDEKKD